MKNYAAASRYVRYCMDGMKYSAQTVTRRLGDKMFLYTDGVTEANDPDEQLYDEERLLAYVNRVRDQSMKDILLSLEADIIIFAREAKQFDDHTCCNQPKCLIYPVDKSGISFLGAEKWWCTFLNLCSVKTFVF